MVLIVSHANVGANVLPCFLKEICMHEQTATDAITKHTNTHACALIILGPGTEEKLLI